MSSADRCAALRNRARRCARKKQYRKAALALREAAALDGAPATWTMLGAMLRRARREGEAIVALRQAEWLHRRAGSVGRAAAVARLIATG